MPVNIGVYGWTVPEGTDAPAGPEQLTELANDIATTVKAIDNRVAAQEVAALTVLKQTTQQDITTGVMSSLSWQTEVTDTSGMHATNSTQLICTVAGWYLLGGNVGFAFHATGRRGAYWLIDGALVSGALANAVSTGSVGNGMALPAVMAYLAIGKVVEVQVFQDSGTTLKTAAAGSYGSVVWARRMSA